MTISNAVNYQVSLRPLHASPCFFTRVAPAFRIEFARSDALGELAFVHTRSSISESGDLREPRLGMVNAEQTVREKSD
jgi:hypothetical protein